MSGILIRKAHTEDLSRIINMLETERLTTVGVGDHLPHFLVAERSGVVTGAMGLEVYEETALLRSAVVVPSERDKGIGAQLYDALLDHAHDMGVKRLLLLTTTAETYFAGKGFRVVERSSVQGRVTSSAEFRGACPSTAVCMELMI